MGKKYRWKKKMALLMALALVVSLPVGFVQTKAKLRLNRTKVTLRIGEKVTLKVLGASSRQKKKILWKTSNKKVATVSKKGVVKAKSKGNAKITVRFSGKKHTCKVVVKKKSLAKNNLGISSTSKGKPSSSPVATSAGGTSEPGQNKTQEPKVTWTPIPTPTPTPTPTPREGIVFSQNSGVYTTGFDLTIQGPEGTTIYYTTDGSEPLYEEKENSAGRTSFPAKQATKKYEGSILVKDRDKEANVLCARENISCLYLADWPFYPSIEGVPKATVIRAVAVDAKGKKSGIVTRVYYINKDFKKLYPNASVLSIVTDPDNLLNETTGIMHSNNVMESGEEWERPADILYIDEDGTIPVDATVGIRIHGGYSRRWGQKSFRLYFRENYGQKNIKGYQIIPGAMNHDKTEATTKYKKLIVRNGGNDYAQTKMQDVFTQSLVENRAFATQSARPCVVYLNGEYWGLYNLTERYSDDFLETEFGLKDKSNAVMVKNEEVDTDGEDDQKYYDEFKAMEDWDMTDESKFAAFKERVDYQSFLDYFATEIYISNKDWPNNNIELWRSKKADGTKYGDTKWRYMLFDTDFGMNQYGNSENGVGNPIEWAKKDKIFSSVIKNKQCQQDLVDTIMELAKENFEPVTAKKKLNEMAAIYHPLMDQYRLRFGPEQDAFDSAISRTEEFLDGRWKKMKTYIKKSFGIAVQ